MDAGPAGAFHSSGRYREAIAAFDHVQERSQNQPGRAWEAAARRALEPLEAVVVAGVGHGAELRGFLALGPRRSGDVYTATALALLAEVADALSAQMERLAAAG